MLGPASVSHVPDPARFTVNRQFGMVSRGVALFASTSTGTRIAGAVAATSCLGEGARRDPALVRFGLTVTHPPVSSTLVFNTRHNHLSPPVMWAPSLFLFIRLSRAVSSRFAHAA